MNKQTMQMIVPTELNGQSLEYVEAFCYLGDIIGARGSPIDNFIVRSRSV